ncbi:MAG TPA: Ig-like domain-containing protein [Vicinamibacterales bacterium]|nr:Ig-like domain-containing protein [Vicinamibacterales bacterium]
MRGDLVRLFFLVSLVSSGAASAQTEAPLSVVSAQPSGEIQSLEQAAEIRVRFSEPMVPVGRIPDTVTVPFFSIQPAVAGTFRWAGPTLLIFTPDPKKPLARATRYDVTIAAGATAVSGRRLERPYSFTFTTPTARLLQTDWYRANGRYDAPAVILLRFNQPMRPADVIAHVTARYEPHEWVPPPLSAEQRTRMGAADAARFDARVAAVKAVAASNATVALALATSWDTERFPRSPDLVVLQTTGAPSPDGWLSLTLDTRLPAIEGRATPPRTQTYVARLAPAFFVTGFGCTEHCDGNGYNRAMLRSETRLDAIRRAVAVRDISDRAREVPVQPSPTPRDTARSRDESTRYFSLEDVGFARQPPARTFAIALDAGLQADDGQTLGYRWVGIVENWHETAFTSFGDGHGVWETGGGPLPFHARNFTEARQWAQAITPDRLMPTIRDLMEKGFRAAPPGAGTRRTLGVTPDRIQSHGLDLSRALSAAGTGLVWAAIQPGAPIPQTHSYGNTLEPTATIVQVTNLGITVKDSPQNTLVFVTRLDTGAPVGNADVSIIRTDNGTAWTGKTGADGIVIAPQARLRNPRQPYKFSFIVTASKDGDVAYVGSDWNEGIEPYFFGTPYDVTEAEPLLRGTVFSDRGVYKLGEEVHFKAVLRRDTPTGIQTIASGTPLYVAIKDSRDRVIDSRTVTINAWSTTEWTARLAGNGALGNYSIEVTLDKSALEEKTPAPPREIDDDEPWEPEYRKIVRGSFLVAAYRRPEFRVDVQLGADVPAPMAGVTLKGAVNARYLFGAAMANRPARWTFSRTPVYQAPPPVQKAYPSERFAFVGFDRDRRGEGGELAATSASIDQQGRLTLDLETRPSDGFPYEYTLEADVEDVSRQHIANRASFVVHPAPWYVGLKRPSLFVDRKEGLSTEVVAVAPNGTPVPGVAVDVTLVQIQWHSVRRAEGNGFYTWDTERKETEAGHFTITTGSEPVPLAVPLGEGGSYMLRAAARDGAFQSTTNLSFYALGAGYTAWGRYDHNRIDLVPERDTYKPGETARLMIQSPWESATALLTVEREGIRSHSQFALTSTQQTVTVPITAADIPNLFVSVVLIKGRTKADAADDTSDPGKPAFRLGYARLAVEDATKRLTMAVKANKAEFRPAGPARVDVQVTDNLGAPAASEVTLWAVDYGVLSLTGFRTPDVLRSVYVPKALEVMNEDSRQRIVSRRVLTPKGTDEGGGGGDEGGVNAVRRDFRVLAFWLGSVITDSRGHASVDVKLPESLTTYRIMAVSGDKASRFGSGESEIRINKPVVLKSAFPRFLTRGDRAYFGSVITSQLKEAGTATITMRSLDPEVLEIAGDARRSVRVGANASIEVRFDVVAKNVGRARVQTSVRLGGESDAFEEIVPVEITVSPESVAAYGEAAPDAAQPLSMPAGIVPNVGGLHVELASTALVGLGEGARYVVEYPFGCLEQRASRTFVLATAADLGAAFTLPGIDARDIRPRVQSSLRELETFQCPSGGFAFWPGHCRTVSPFLTSYALHVFQTAASLKYDVNAEVMRQGYDYLEHELAQPPPTNEGWWPMYTAWETFAIKVLVHGRRTQDSNINRLYQYRDRMPVFALAYLHDAMTGKGETGARPADLRRRMTNAILPEAGAAHVEELNDPYLLWFWNSNVRSSAIVLDTLVRSGAEPGAVTPIVRWLMTARTNGRWGNTQENAIAMQALVDYYRKYEPQTPNFTATVRLGTDDLLRATFKGRSTEATTKDVPMAALAKEAAAARDLTLRRDGEGTLFYAARLTYAPDAAALTARDNGFRIERTYATAGGDAAGTSVKAGDLVRVTLSFDLPKERRYVAVTDPVPAGFEPVESWFNTTAADVAKQTEEQEGTDTPSWEDVWKRGTFDRVERHDDRVLLFATRLAGGHHEFSYIVRATTAGSFLVAPAQVEEMYAPEISGRTATATIEVKR